MPLAFDKVAILAMPNRFLGPRCLLRLLIVTAGILIGFAPFTGAQVATPTGVAVGPWRTGVAVTCPGGRVIPANTEISGPDVTPEQLCGLHSSSGTSSTGGAVISNTGNFKQDTLTNTVNLMIVSNTKNPIMSSFMQGAATGFISSMFANNAEAQRQQQLMAQEIVRRQQELERQRRIAEQQRLDAMFARLNSALKLEGLPFNLSLKGMTSSSPESLQLKGMDSSGPGDLKLKIVDSSPTSYGLKGLPGIYVGGPADGESTSSNSPATANAAPGTAGTNPNLVSGPGTGTTGSGIPGLPGIYLDRVQSSQAPQLAQVAETLKGPERAAAQDVALQAAQQNPTLTAPSGDPKVQNFQQANQEYQQALAANNTASQDYQTAQTHVDSDKSAVDVARAQLSAIAPSAQQQQAFNQMLAAANTDEQAAMLARRGFDSTEVHLSVSRDRAATVLASISPASNPSSSAPVVGLHPNAVVANLKTPDRSGTSVSLPMPKVASNPMPPKPLPTQQQLRVRLEGLQEALRRLAEDEAKRGEARQEAAKDVDEAVSDAEMRGVNMLFDLVSTGWDNCAPLAQGGIVGKFERDAARIDGQIQDVYKEASVAKAGSDLGAFNEKAEELEKTKLWLERSIGKIETTKHALDVMNAAGETKEVWKDSKGDWQSSLEGMGKVVGMALDDKRITDYLASDKIGMVTCHVAAIKATDSAIESALDIFKEGNAAEDLRRMDENTMKFLAAQKVLDQKLKATTAQLNCYKLPDPATVVSCVQKVGQPQ